MELLEKNITFKTLPLPNEAYLLLQVADSDEKAFGTLFHHYRNKIYSYAFHLLESSDMADELVQDVFLKVWMNRDRLQKIDKFDSWLFIIARNMVFDALKLLSKDLAAKKQWAAIPAAEANSVHNQLINKENEQLLQDALDRLSPQQKKIFLLSRNQGMNHEEIAIRLQISRNTVKTHLVHALKTLRHTLHLHSDSALLVLLLLQSFFS
ncbi:RNA polymerase sigma factor [Flavitalea flava]